MIPDVGPPYPGLRAFEREESDLFFGRETSVDELIASLAKERFLTVLGTSGSGKSSLIRTGLLDALELGFFAHAGSRWTVLDIRPGLAPLRSLADRLAGLLSETSEPMPSEMVRSYLARGPRALAELLKGKPHIGNVLILVDQFEELFRYRDYSALEEAEAFVALLLESARSEEPPPIYVVLTMRSEYLGACDLIPGLARQVNAGSYLTPRMTRGECRAAIEGPARVRGFELEPALTTRILNDMATLAPWDLGGVEQTQELARRADQLPLMQHLLNRLWSMTEGNAAPRRLTLATYEAVGGLSGALDAHGQEVIESLAPADRPTVEHVFRGLVTGPDPVRAVRRPRRLADLEALHSQSGGAVCRVIERFRASDCNFLQPPSDVPLSPETVIDISHESLIRQWRRLAEWQTQEARTEANWRELHRRATDHAQNREGLLYGQTLAELSAWWDAEAPTAEWVLQRGDDRALAERYLLASRGVVEEEAQARRRRRRALEATFAAGVLALGGLLGGGVAFGVASGHHLEQGHSRAEQLVLGCSVRMVDPAAAATAESAPIGALAQVASGRACEDLPRTLREAGYSPGGVVSSFSWVEARNDADDWKAKVDKIDGLLKQSGVKASHTFPADFVAARRIQGALLAKAGEHTRAVDAFAQAERLANEARAQPRASIDDATFADLESELGHELLAAQRPQEASQRLRAALDLRKQLFPKSSINMEADLSVRQKLQDSYVDAAAASMARGDRNGARELFAGCSSAQAGMDPSSIDARRLAADCKAHEGETLSRVDSKAAEHSFDAAIKSLQFDPSLATDDMQERYYALLERKADRYQGEFAATHDLKARRRAFLYRGWLVNTKTDVYGRSPTRAHRDTLVKALMDRAVLYRLTPTGNSDAILDLERAFSLNSSLRPVRKLLIEARLRRGLRGDRARVKRLQRLEDLADSDDESG